MSTRTLIEINHDKLNKIKDKSSAFTKTLLQALRVGGKPWAVKERCINGVTYYVSGYQLSPAFKVDGSLYSCCITTEINRRG